MANVGVVQRFNSEEEFYQCRSCATHIALKSDFLYALVPGANGDTGLAFSEVSNVYKDLVHTRVVGGRVVADIYCVTCSSCIGWEVVDLRIPDPDPDPDDIQPPPDEFPDPGFGSAAAASA
ncbi:unnamed protein product [Ilex paraguariensis]|uniref:Yippee domain-containing protein n=1 Tax=Ilex paraguariensis TaxID=185542 RepID=A0ABC8U0S4_9AQUA